MSTEPEPGASFQAGLNTGRLQARDLMLHQIRETLDRIEGKEILDCLADPERYRVKQALAVLQQVREDYADVFRRAPGWLRLQRTLDRLIEDLVDLRDDGPPPTP